MPRTLPEQLADAPGHLRWLEENVSGFAAWAGREDPEALAALALGLHRLGRDRQLVLADREGELLLARLDVPGSIVETLQRLQDRDIARAEISHSRGDVPGTAQRLELQRFAFGPVPDQVVAQAGDPAIPAPLRAALGAAVAAEGEGLAGAPLDELLRILWLNDRRLVQGAPPRRVAQLLWLLHRTREHAGFYLDGGPAEGAPEPGLVEVRFGVEAPPRRDHLAQVMEAFNALNIGVRGCLTLTVGTGTHPCFLGGFLVKHRAGQELAPGTDLFRRLKRELYNTQILATESPAYHDFVLPRVMTGEEASLLNAMIGFCHTNAAHNQPHKYTLEDVVRAFHSHPDMTLRLVRLFEARFDPELADREARWAAELPRAEQEVATYATGHRLLDEFRRSVFRLGLIFVKHVLKTNFFVPEKHALAFRMDPAYLEELGAEFTADLPPERPFRVTFFFGRGGLGYHIGFADIARGGWRTVFTRTRDDYVTVANRVFRECYVLAHTQHLKNKDIYEGGSKLVAVLRAPDAVAPGQVNQRLHRLQRDFAEAFLDVFVTDGGRARDPRVVDHYGEDEPIELGPDENMHDEMVEAIAALSVRRGYLLGPAIMSSKRVGINHKEFGVTSLGVITFAATAMRERGVDLRRDPFTVKFTGGPNGDVAGNAMRLLLERCPGARIRLIVDGTAALYDPAGLDREALAAVVLRADADGFDPARLSPGGFALYRSRRRTEGLRELFRRVERTADGLREEWVTLDEFHKEYEGLLFTVPADLFLPAGGRPETIDRGNWRRYLLPDGQPSAPVIVEGANSFITPEARDLLQEAGAVILRDASANKCGVISSSYEIIGNLLFDPAEFLEHKARYVADVLEILERRAADEAELLFRRRREEGGKRSFTALSAAISAEIIAHKARLFSFFQARPELAGRPAFRRALLAHLPRMVREEPRWAARVDRLPQKYRSAILAAELGTSMVYRRPLEPDFGAALEAYAGTLFG